MPMPVRMRPLPVHAGGVFPGPGGMTALGYDERSASRYLRHPRSRSPLRGLPRNPAGGRLPNAGTGPSGRQRPDL